MPLLSRRASSVLLSLMGLFLIGTVLVLAVVRTHFRVDELSYIRETELGTWDEIRRNARPHILDSAPDALGEEGPSDQIPRIIHQTWKTEELPERWKGAREHCAALMPDYEYMLWTDASARAFIAGEYAWFLDTYDSYRYNIERADVIRYFVLHKYGGIYMDLDIGCRRRLDSLLRFDAIVPKTIPVGVSNDLMLFKPGEPMLELLIQNLKRFNHNLITPYATIMFSTGPMYVSAVYRMNADANPSVGPSTPTDPTVGFRGVRVLPKFLYGKNAKPGETPDSFFDHMYGSSWHEGDADFLIFLRKHGRLMMAGAGVLVVLGLRRYYFGVLRVIFFALLSLVHSLATVLQRMYNDVRSMLGMASDSACLEQELAPLAPATRPGSPWDAPNVKVTQASPASGVSSVATSQLIHPPHCAADSAMDEHTQRTTQKDEALGTYSKRCDAWSTHNQSTNLPAYYVDCGSEYAMNTPRNDHLVQNEAPPRENDAQSMLLARHVWRTMRPSVLFEKISKPRRRNTEPDAFVERSETVLRNVSIDGTPHDYLSPCEPLSRTISNQSDDYRGEFATIVRQQQHSLASPNLWPRMSPSPTLLLPPDEPPIPTYRTRVMRRQPVVGSSRATTPSVPEPCTAHYAHNEY